MMARIKLIVILFGSLAVAASQKTVWDGVYTAAQAGRGKALYTMNCQGCHKEDLSGRGDTGLRSPALKGDRIISRKDVNNLFAYIKLRMPADDPGSLDDQTTVDIVSYILQQNSFPDGAEELKADPDSLKQIQIVKKE